MEDQPNVTRRKPSRFRPLHSFSLRTLLIGVTLLAVACGYVGWQAKFVRERRAMLELIVHDGGGYFYFVGDSTCWSLPYGGKLKPKGTHRLSDGNEQAPSMVRQWLGDDFVYVILLPKSVPSADATRIVQVFPEATVFSD
jgi:hypothetical protein